MSEQEATLEEEREDRLDELEIRYTHQSDTLRALHEVVWAQERRIKALEAEVLKLTGHFRELADAPPGESIPNERPPHY